MTDVTVPTTWSPEDLGPMAAETLMPADRYLLYAPNSSLIDKMMAEVNLTFSRNGLGGE